MRPLGLIEIMPMPYVTESSVINLVTSFECDNQFRIDEINNFFSMYQRYVLDVKDQSERIKLYITYLYSADSDMNNVCSTFIQPLIKELMQKRYSSLMTTHINEIRIDLNNSLLNKHLSVIEAISRKLSNESLILYVDNCVELQGEFLNRVRLNTVLNTQVFFPIPFDSYMPQLAYSSKPYPIDIEINKYNGYFNRFSYQFSSFYNLDFIKARANYLKEFELNKITYRAGLDLYELFSTKSRLHLLRATDQALKCRWSNNYLNMDKKSLNDEYFKSKLNTIGTKAQLAMHLMKNYEKIFNNNNK